MDVLTDYPNHASVFSSIQSSRVIARNKHQAEVLQVRKHKQHVVFKQHHILEHAL